MALLINGRFLDRPLTGVERYGRLLLSVIAAERPDARVIVPTTCGMHGTISGLEIVPHGRTRGHVWEQVELPRILGKDDVLLSPANTGPLKADNHVTVIHDLAFIHHPEWFNARFATWYKLLMPRLVRHSSRVIAVSGTIGAELERFFGLPHGQVAIVPPFVDPSLMGPMPGQGRERPYYLMVSSLDPRKGLDRVLNWFTGLQRPGFDLVIVGRTGRAFNKVDIPRNERIEVIEQVDDARLAALYSGAIALVQASYYEGFGLPVLEALALGCPVIASPLPVFEEQFGDDILYADIGYTRSMMRAMVRVNDPAERASLVARGRARAARFTPARTATALRNVLAPLIDRA